jgi:hypothetical protein
MNRLETGINNLQKAISDAEVARRVDLTLSARGMN